jgi:murein DD-endopeptidase MepM/ murein hydrolase activator NlpD
MLAGDETRAGSRLSRIRHFFRARDVFLHDGASMSRIHLSSKLQISGAAFGLVAAVGAVFSLGQVAVGAVSTGKAVSTFATHRAEIAQMENKVEALQDDVRAVKLAAKAHADRLEARQAFLAAVLKGEGDPAKLAALLPARAAKGDSVTAEVASVFNELDREQVAMAVSLRQQTEARYASTAQMVAKLGLVPTRVQDSVGGMGGPYEPLPAVSGAAATPAKADPNFRALFDSWKKLDQLQTGLISVPSQKPIQTIAINSGFGVRSDPFRGGRAMHAGVDMPGPMGTPIYATADAVVGRAGWVGGYGNLVELEHGKGIQTRYGHLSSIIAVPGARIKRGQLIGLMGSTGRSTGSHLHYEVRIDGRAVNPVPFLQTSDYLLAMQERGKKVALGGPVESGKVAAGTK